MQHVRPLKDSPSNSNATSNSTRSFKSPSLSSSVVFAREKVRFFPAVDYPDCICRGFPCIPHQDAGIEP
jgi:hypothetical protein